MRMCHHRTPADPPNTSLPPLPHVPFDEVGPAVSSTDRDRVDSRWSVCTHPGEHPGLFVAPSAHLTVTDENLPLRHSARDWNSTNRLPVPVDPFFVAISFAVAESISITTTEVLEIDTHPVVVTVDDPVEEIVNVGIVADVIVIF
jgi:hypothetical protein